MSPFGSMCMLSLVAAGAAVGCIGTPTLNEPGADADLQLVVLDARGDPMDALAMPRRPQLALRVPPGLALQASSVLLFEGAPDDALQRDLERMPLTSANARRLVPTAPSVTPAQDTHIRVAPRNTLARAATYTLAVPRAALAAGARVAFLQELRTADSPLAGAAVSGAFPGDGSAGVASDLRLAVLTFDGSVEGVEDAVWLEDSAGWAVPAALEASPCEDLASDAAACVQISPQAALDPGERYALRTGRGLRDAHDADVEAFSASFSTADASGPPAFAWLAGGCALDELSLPIGCALLGDVSIQLRMRPASPARVIVQLGQERAARLSSGQSIDVSFSELAPDSDYALAVTAQDAAGQRVEAHQSLHTAAALATLSISEVRADPLGSEPAQEYVEVLNFGAQPIDVDGFTLSDAPDATGTRIDAEVPLPAGAHALIVPAAFDETDPRDAAPAPGALLLRTAAALTHSGLANSGEMLWLRDRQGRRLSAAPATPPPRPGVCIARTSADPRTGAPGSFAYDPDGGCTPGR
jgi:hypothetical protein